MAISLTELGNKLQRAGEAIRADAPRLIRQQAQTGLSLLEERSIQEGIEVNGSKQQYSNKPVYRSGFAAAARNGAGRAWTSDKSNKKGTWGEFREAQGLDSSAVNLFYTGRMWTSIHVTDGPQEGNTVSAYVAPSDRESALKLIGNLKRYGPFMDLREGEVQQLQADLRDDITDYFKTLMNRA